MDRRKSIKTLALGTVSTGLLLDACKLADKGEAKETAKEESASVLNPSGYNRMPEELAQEKKIISYTFFTPEEMATISVLVDIIIPKDAISGSATDAKVPEFIEYIVKDMPEHQVPMRGGLRWLNLQCFDRYQNAFADCSQQQQLAMVDEIAYPDKAKPDMKQGVAFFNLMRNLTATGFYTSEMGVKDVGYMGNQPNQWNGVPDDVLKQYGMAYTEKELKECRSFS